MKNSIVVLGVLTASCAAFADNSKGVCTINTSMKVAYTTECASYYNWVVLNNNSVEQCFSFQVDSSGNPVPASYSQAQANAEAAGQFLAASGVCIYLGPKLK